MTFEGWNKNVLGNLFIGKNEIWARLEGAQKKLMQGPNNFLLKLEARLCKELDVVLV